MSKLSLIAHKDTIGRSPLIHSLMLKYRSFSSNMYNSHRIQSDVATYELGFSGRTYVELPKCFGSDFMGLNGPESCSKTKKMETSLKSNANLHDVISCRLIKLLNSDVNVSDIQGNTPISLICDNNDVFLFDMLLQNPSFDPHFKNSKGISCYNYIKNKYEREVCTIFGTETYCPLEICSKHEKFSRQKEIEIIKEVAKEISSQCSDSSLDSEDCLNESMESMLDDQLECDLDCTNKILSVSPEPRLVNIYKPVGINSCVKSQSYSDSCSDLYFGQMESKENWNDDCKPNFIDELSLKKFSTIKYFYEKLRKLYKP